MRDGNSFGIEKIGYGYSVLFWGFVAVEEFKGSTNAILQCGQYLGDGSRDGDTVW